MYGIRHWRGKVPALCLDPPPLVSVTLLFQAGEGGINRHAVTVLLTSASSCLALGRWEEAMDKFQEVLKLLPKNAPEHTRALIGAVEAASHISLDSFERRQRGQTDDTGGPAETKTRGSGAVGGGAAGASRDDNKRNYAARSELLYELKQKLPQKVLLLDSDELERHEPAATSGGRRAGGGAGKKGAESGEGSDAVEGPTAKKKKKKRPRWPKGFDPNVPQMPPDPERWIRKCER